MDNHTKPKLLITEDDFENQKFLQLFLRKEFEITLCDSEQSFYECLNNNSYDIILMDISLRGKKNGLDLTKELKSIDKYKDIPVVCLTAHAFNKDRENAINAGVDVFLTKPVDNHILMDSLKSALKNKV